MEIAHPLVQKAFAAAVTTRARAYTPYSRFKVGAALILADDQIVGGCNVENASFGGTVCAERIALFRMVAEHGVSQVKAVVVVAEVQPTVVPCGLCLQVLSELCAPGTPIFLGDTSALRERTTLASLMPRSFSASSLPG